MSDLTMTTTEEKDIDSRNEKMIDWAKTRNVEAEQLAMDSARLLAASTDRLDRLAKQPFFKRCWSRFNGDMASLERATVNDVIQMQKTAFRYVNMLQEQQLLMANSLLSLKNNLNSLAIKEEETRKLIALLADRTRERFEKLENRVDQLEISTNLQGWLLGLDQRDYDEKYPTEYMRLLRVINDFYSLKKSGWNYNDLVFMRKAIQTVGLNPKEKVSLNKFIDKLTEEIQNKDVGIEGYTKAISAFKPDGVDNYSQFAVDNVSSPVYATLHGLKTHYEDKADAVEALQDSLSISAPEALKVLIKNSIKGMNINLDYESTLAEIALEILGCMSLEEELLVETQSASDDKSAGKSSFAAQTHARKKGEENTELFDSILETLLKLPIKNFKEDSFFIAENGRIIGNKLRCLDEILAKFGESEKNVELVISTGTKGIILLKNGVELAFNMIGNEYAKNEGLDGVEKLNNLANDVKNMLREAAIPPLEVLKGKEAIEFIFDNAEAINSKSEPFDKDKFFLDIDEESWGHLPDEAKEIISELSLPININDIHAYLRDGHRGLMIVVNDNGNEEDVSLIHFDLSANKFAIIKADEQSQKEVQQVFEDRFGAHASGNDFDQMLHAMMTGYMHRLAETVPELGHLSADGIDII